MERKRTKNPRQPEMETKETVDFEQSAEALISEHINSPNDTTDEKTFFSKYKNVIFICCAVATAIGTLLIGIAAIRPNSLDLKLNSEDIVKIVQVIKSEKSSQIEESLQKVEQNPKASVIDKAIVAAYRLQEDKKIEEAMEKWSSIANIAEGIDDDLASRAWFSIGYLYSELARGFRSFGSFYMEGIESKSAISAYDRAIHLKPDFVEAYFNRGISKKILRQYDAAIADFSKVITLNPDFADAYSDRGNVKNMLGQYSTAIADANEALRLKPDSPNAYAVRGEAKVGLDNIEDAKVDFETALKLAKEQEDADLKANLEKRIQALNDME